MDISRLVYIHVRKVKPNDFIDESFYSKFIRSARNECRLNLTNRESLCKTIRCEIQEVITFETAIKSARKGG